MEIIGRTSADAVVNETKAGKKVMNFTIAINHTYKTKGSNEMQKTGTYLNCSYWLNAEVASYCKLFIKFVKLETTARSEGNIDSGLQLFDNSNISKYSVRNRYRLCVKLAFCPQCFW